MCSCDVVLVATSAQFWEKIPDSLVFPLAVLCMPVTWKILPVLFLLWLSWLAASISFSAALQCLILWQVKLTGQKWKKNPVLFCQSHLHCWYICFYWVALYCYKRRYVCVTNLSLGLSDLSCVCVYHQTLGRVLGSKGKLHNCKIGVAFRVFDADFVFFKLLQQ